MNANQSERTDGKKRYHFAVLMFGTSSVFIKLINMSATGIVVGRFFISATTMFLFFAFNKKLNKIWTINKKSLLFMFFAGVLLALHAWAFVTSIQLTSVAIATITHACFPVFSLLLEKTITRNSSEIKPFMMVSALLTIVGAIVLIPELSLQNANVLGVLVGLLSALSFASHLIVNDKARIKIKTQTGVGKDIGLVTTFYTHFFAALILSPVAAILMSLNFKLTDVVYLLVLGSIVTALGFAIYYSALESYNPTTLGIASSLEAVYGISLALLVMQTYPTTRELIGGAIIISAVTYNEWKRKHSDRLFENRR